MFIFICSPWQTSTILTETLEMKETVRTLRNLVILLKIVGGLDPRLLEGIQSAITNNIARARNQDPPSLFKVGERFTSRGSRRALGMLAGVMEAVGQDLITAEVQTDQSQKRKRTTRHSA